jgi:hypothetical protein
MAVSVAGIFVVLDSTQEIAGVLLIAAGVVVAFLGLRSGDPKGAA